MTTHREGPVRKDAGESKFVLDLPRGQAYVAYNEIGEDVLDFRSTWVPPEHRNAGIGERLVLTALERAREDGYRVVPSCPFVSWVVERNPQYGKILTER